MRFFLIFLLFSRLSDRNVTLFKMENVKSHEARRAWEIFRPSKKTLDKHLDYSVDGDISPIQLIYCCTQITFESHLGKYSVPLEWATGCWEYYCATANDDTIRATDSSKIVLKSLFVISFIVTPLIVVPSVKLHGR